MQLSDTVLPTLTSYAVQLPVFIVWIVGLVLAIVNWPRHPRLSLLVVIGLGVLLLLALVDTYLGLWLMMYLLDRGMTSVQIGTVGLVIRVVLALITAAAWVPLMIALFQRRTPQS